VAALFELFEDLVDGKEKKGLYKIKMKNKRISNMQTNYK